MNELGLINQQENLKSSLGEDEPADAECNRAGKEKIRVLGRENETKRLRFCIALLLYIRNGIGGKLAMQVQNGNATLGSVG